MPLQIKDTSSVPKGDWNYYIESTNYTITTKNYHRLYPMVVEHCTTNNVPVPSEQEVIDQMCDKLYIPCFESTDMQDTVRECVDAWASATGGQEMLRRMNTTEKYQKRQEKLRQGKLVFKAFADAVKQLEKNVKQKEKCTSTSLRSL